MVYLCMCIICVLNDQFISVSYCYPIKKVTLHNNNVWSLKGSIGGCVHDEQMHMNRLSWSRLRDFHFNQHWIQLIRSGIRIEPCITFLLCSIHFRLQTNSLWLFDVYIELLLHKNTLTGKIVRHSTNILINDHIIL